MRQQENQGDILVRPLQQSDLTTADHVLRLAFGTFLGLPEPTAFLGDADYVRTRWAADPLAAFGAVADDSLVGSNFATNWGSVGFFGPLTIRPDFWDRGVGKRLMEPIMERLNTWGVRHAGLFTFAQSTKHVGLYQKFGFWPRYLTAILSKAVDVRADGTMRSSLLSEVEESQRENAFRTCRELTDSVFEGLDVTREIRAVAEQALGDTVLLWRDSQLAGVAVCHSGPGSEAGSGVCYIKFGVVRSGPGAARHFGELAAACERFAASRGAARVIAGVNSARSGAYTELLRKGFRSDFLGVAMQRPNEPGYNRAETFLIDDWR
jgi:GNAT superfamily N-acetyltransferase